MARRMGYTYTVYCVLWLCTLGSPPNHPNHHPAHELANSRHIHHEHEIEKNENENENKSEKKTMDMDMVMVMAMVYGVWCLGYVMRRWQGQVWS